MGFHAPSTDEVFKYALRLDNSSRRLTDGFGMSIVLVNDSSPVCVEFLTRYFIDLCERTADRIRFVFFSGVPEREVSGIVDEQNRASNITGLLGGILRRLPGGVGGRRAFQAALDDLLHNVPSWYGLDELKRTDLADWSDWQVAELVEVMEHFTPDERGTRLMSSIRKLCEDLLSSHQAHYWSRSLVRRLERLREFADPGRESARGEWGRLTPHALNPVNSPQDTFDRLGWKCDAMSSVNGAGMAMEFAQRLGIGRHVPCVLVFTDVGELRIDLMPITRDMTAEDVYAHVREWVDRFYEVNRDRFQRWREIEEEIDRLSRQTSSSLYRLREWADQGAQTWRALRCVTRMLDDLNHLAHNDHDGWGRAVRRHINEYSFPAGVKEDFRQYLPSLDHMSARAGEHARLRKALPLVENAEGAEGILDALGALNKERERDLPDAARATLEASLKELGQHAKAVKQTDAVAMLQRWWKGSVGNRPSFRKFKEARDRWPHKGLAGCKGSAGDYDLLLESLRSLRIKDDPEQGADFVLSELMRCCAGADEDGRWRAATDAYKQSLAYYLVERRRTAPPWLLEELPELTVGEAGILPERNASKVSAEDIPEPLIQAARRRQPEQAGQSETLHKEFEREAAERRAAVADAVRQAVKSYESDAAEAELLHCRIIGELIRSRSGLAREVEAAEVRLPPPQAAPTRIDREAVERLRRAVDTYEGIAHAILYPHRHDPQVQSVSLLRTVTDAVGIKGDVRVPERRVPEQLRMKIHEVAVEDERAGKLYEELLQAQPRWTPAAQLANALEALGERRLNEVLSAGLKGDVRLRLREALLYGRAEPLLETLTDGELGQIIESLSSGVSPKTDAPPTSRRARIRSILALVGADPMPSLMGQETLKNYVTALNDKHEELTSAEVSHYGTDLRRMLEHYLKQFLLTYAPLALSREERQAVHNATLGPLKDLTSRVIRGHVLDSEIHSDERWQKTAEKLRVAATLNDDTITRVIEALNRIPLQANRLAHHVIIDGREMSEEERRKALRNFVHDTLVVVDGLWSLDLYPICLRFTGVTPDDMFVARFEFDSDPRRSGKEIVAFSKFPPSIPGMDNFFETLYRQILLMVPFSNPERIDPILVPLVST
jgi:hypothetical protein